MSQNPQQGKFTGLKDTDRVILQQLNDTDLFSACQTNRYLNELCNDDFFRARFRKFYPEFVTNKPEHLSWKAFYLFVIHNLPIRDSEYNALINIAEITARRIYRQQFEIHTRGVTANHVNNLLNNWINRFGYILTPQMIQDTRNKVADILAGGNQVADILAGGNHNL